MRKHYTEEQRAEVVRLVREEKVSFRRAAAQVGVAEATAYYWVKRAMASAGSRAAGPANSVGKPGARAAGRPSRQVPASSRQQAAAAPAMRAAPTEVAFARLVPASEHTVALTVRVGAAAIDVRAGFDAALLRAVVAALAETA